MFSAPFLSPFNHTESSISSSKTTKDKQEKKPFFAYIKCINCNRVRELKIPYGITLEKYMEKRKCIKCGNKPYKKISDFEYRDTIMGPGW